VGLTWMILCSPMGSHCWRGCSVGWGTQFGDGGREERAPGKAEDEEEYEDEDEEAPTGSPF